MSFLTARGKKRLCSLGRRRGTRLGTQPGGNLAALRMHLVFCAGLQRRSRLMAGTTDPPVGADEIFSICIHQQWERSRARSIRPRLKGTRELMNGTPDQVRRIVTTSEGRGAGSQQEAARQLTIDALTSAQRLGDAPQTALERRRPWRRGDAHIGTQREANGTRRRFLLSSQDFPTLVTIGTHLPAPARNCCI